MIGGQTREWERRVKGMLQPGQKGTEWRSVSAPAMTS